MFGALDISVSALVAQRTRVTAISQNVAMANVPVPLDANPDDFRRRMVLFAPGDPSTGSSRGVHVQQIMLDPSEFRLKLEKGHPYANKEGFVRYPNVDPTMQQIDALDARRAYEANITAAEATKNMIQASLRLLA